MTASSYILEIEEKCHQANLTSLEILKTLKVREEEIERLHVEYGAKIDALQQEIVCLKQYIIDLKSRVAVYIPVKNDPVDFKLAEYINNFPDTKRLKVMFLRESSGVYEFGSKKISVKVENNKI